MTPYPGGWSRTDLERLRIALAIPLSMAAVDALLRAMERTAQLSPAAIATAQALVDRIAAIDQARAALQPDDFRSISSERHAGIHTSVTGASIHPTEDEVRCQPISTAAALQQQRLEVVEELLLVLPDLAVWSNRHNQQLPPYTAPLLRG